MKLGIKGGVGWYGGLAETAATKEGDKGSYPYCSMKGIGEVKCLAKDEEMFCGNGSTKGALMAGAIALCGCVAHGNPTVVAIPWSTIDNMPSMNASHPSLDCVSGNLASMLTDESTKKRPCCRHPIGLRDVPTITELGEMKDTSAVIAFGVGGIK